MRQHWTWFGAGLVVLGSLLLLRELGVLPDVSLWSAFLLGLGAWMVIGNMTGRGGSWLWSIGVLAAGVLLVLRDLDVLPEDFSVWPVVIIVIGLAVVLGSIRHRRSEPRRPGAETTRRRDPS